MTRVGATILLEVDNGQPVLRPRGYYSAPETYVYNSEFRDYVLLDSVDGTGNRLTHYFIVRNFGDEISGVAPVPGDKSTSRVWEESTKIEFIVANSITADMIQAGAITASKLQVAGFNFEDNYIWGGNKFGGGAGIDILSLEGDRCFRAYKDASRYVEMFQREDEWGFRGVDGSTLFTLGRKLVDGTWKDNNKVAGWTMRSTGLESEDFAPPAWSSGGVSGGMGSKLFPDGGIMLIPNGTGILPSSSGMMQAGLVKAEGENSWITGLEIVARNTDPHGYLANVTALRLSARIDYAYPKSRPVALDVMAGDVNIANGMLCLTGGCSEMAAPVGWVYVNKGTIPTAGVRLVYVTGNTGSDNPCYLGTSGARDGQVVTVVNTSTDHRLNVNGTAKGNHWILEGCCGTFRYLSGYGLWYPERFSW